MICIPATEQRLVRGLLGAYAIAEIIEDGKQKLSAMIERTKRLLGRDMTVI